MDNSSLLIIQRNIQSEIMRDLERVGIHYRLHSRIKESESLNEKIETKGEGYYSVEGKKIQDIIGFRITTYFIDDVKLLWDYFYKKYDRVDDEYDKATADIFKPLRKNLICRMNKENSDIFHETKLISPSLNLVDNTYEIQFRTTLSEGWHEVDHALRYKCKNDWKNYPEEDRMLNGVFASLETSDRALKALFDDLAYNHYKQKNWEAMLRTKFRIRFEKKIIGKDIDEILNKENGIAKKIFRFNRNELLKIIANSGLYLPISFNNIIFIINRVHIKNQEITHLTPQFIIEEFKQIGL